MHISKVLYTLFNRHPHKFGAASIWAYSSTCYSRSYEISLSSRVSFPAGAPLFQSLSYFRLFAVCLCARSIRGRFDLSNGGRVFFRYCLLFCLICRVPFPRLFVPHEGPRIRDLSPALTGRIKELLIFGQTRLLGNLWIVI